MHGGGRYFAPPDVRSQGYATIFARWPLQTPLPAPEGVVPKKLKALIQVCFSGQTVEVGPDTGRVDGLWRDHADRGFRHRCQIASNSDPLFASNRDPSLAAAWSLSTSCIGGTRARS